MVEEIVAGTYVPVDNRDANYYAERLTHSAPRKANSQVELDFVAVCMFLF